MTCSIRTRLTLWYGGLTTAALVALSAGVLWLQARAGLAQFDAELSSLGTTVSRVMQEELEERGGNFPRAVGRHANRWARPIRATAILDLTGHPLVARWQGFHYDAVTPMMRPGFATVSEAGRSWRLLIRRETSSAGDYYVLVGGPLDQVTQQRSLVGRILLVATPLISFSGTGRDLLVGGVVCSSTGDPDGGTSRSDYGTLD